MSEESSGFKMKGSPMHAGTAAHASALKQAWFGYWGKKSEPVVNEDGSVTTSRKNIFTGDVKSTTTSTGEGDWGGTKTTKTTQKTTKSGDKARVKSKSTETGGRYLGDTDVRKTKTKTKLTNYEGTDDYKVTGQKVVRTGKFGGKKLKRTVEKNTGGHVGSTGGPDVKSGFQDPRIDQTTGEFMDESNPNYPSSYSEADEKSEIDPTTGYPTKFYHRQKKKWVPYSK